MINHKSNCTVYIEMSNNSNSNSGICTCGYGLHKWMNEGDGSEMYSSDLLSQLQLPENILEKNAAQVRKVLEEIE